MKLVPTTRQALDAFLKASEPATLPLLMPSPEEIMQAESTLGHRLPESFKAFMREAGSRHIAFWETFLVGGESLGWRDLVRNNLALREDPSVLLPAYLLAFATDGSGGYQVFDTRHVGPEHEYPVRHWEHEASREENVAGIGGPHHYFPEWLLREVERIAT